MLAQGGVVRLEAGGTSGETSGAREEQQPKKQKMYSVAYKIEFWVAYKNSGFSAAYNFFLDSWRLRIEIDHRLQKTEILCRLPKKILIAYKN